MTSLELSSTTFSPGLTSTSLDQMVTTFGKLVFMAIGDEVDDDRRIDATRIIGSVWFAVFMV